jgi:hypothetical protein
LALGLGVATACGGQSEPPSGDSSGDAGDGGTTTSGGTNGVAGDGGTTTSGGTNGVAGTIDTGGTVAEGGRGGDDGSTAGATALGGAGGAEGGAGGAEGGEDGGTGGPVPTGGTGGSGGRRPCVYGGQTYEDGARFPAVDGCNTCMCVDGRALCTLIACPPPGNCDELEAAYQQTFQAAKTCSQDLEGQCLVGVRSAPECGCLTFVNDPAAVRVLSQIMIAWTQRGCGGEVTCDMCPPDPISADCSSDGVCVE